MGRPIKIGLDYFPVDIIFDDNVELLQAECGIQSVGILIKLWQKIYRNGYFIEWNSDSLLLFNQHNGLSQNETDKVLEVCFKRNIFCKELFEKYGILTSRGIQKRFLQIAKDSKRTSILIISEYKLVNGEFNGIITGETHVTSEFSAQSKVKKSKEEKSKEEKSKRNKKPHEKQADLNDFDFIPDYIKPEILEFISYRKSIKAPMNQHAVELLLKELFKLSDNEHDQKAILNQSILNNWKGVFPLKNGNKKPQSMAQGFEEALNDIR